MTSTTTKKSKSIVKTTTNENETMNNNFTILDDDSDTLEYSTDILNQYFQSGHLNEYDNYDEIISDEQLLNDYFNMNEATTQMDEIVLSQTFQDSLTTTDDHNEQVQTLVTSNQPQQSSSESCTNINTKKRKTTDDDDTDNTNMNLMFETCSIPFNLLITNKLFIQMVNNVIELNKLMTINDIHDIAMLIYKKNALQIDRDITKAYFHAVQGTLREPELELNPVKRSVLPRQVQSFMLAKSKTTTTSTTSFDVNDEQQIFICSELLIERVLEIKEKISIYEEELDDKKKSLVDFTTQMEDLISSYIQQYCIIPLEMKRKLKMTLLHYDFDTELLKRQYLQEKPNDYQLKIAKALYDSKRELEKSKRQLFELKEQVFYNKTLSIFDDSYEKLIQQKKLDLMIIKITEVETKFYQNQQVFDNHMSTMWRNHRDLVRNQGMTTTLTNIIDKTLDKITDQWRAIYNYRIDYYLRNSYDNTHGKHMQKFAFSSFVIMDQNYKFTDKQIQLLNRGPTYVPPFQLSITTTIKTLDDKIKKEYEPLKQQLSHLFSHYHINKALSMQINTKMFNEFKENFSLTIPTIYQERAIYERNLVQSIRSSLNNKHLILRRTADNSNTFYIGNRIDFELKANDYLQHSDAIEYITDIESNPQWRNEFQEMINSMNKLLDQLKQNKSIDNDIYNRLVININKVQLASLYFLPDISKENEISLVPYINTQNNPTTQIGLFLHQILYSFVDKILKSTTFRDDIDFLQKLTGYIKKQYRRLPTQTIFCTIEITNFSTLDNHMNMIDTVISFLQNNMGTNKLKCNILTMKNLLHIYLNNNIFLYKNKIYKMRKGSPMTMPLSETLANIYIFKWQNLIFDHLRKYNEFYGRYKNQLFFTWTNGNESELSNFLQTIKEKQSNVHFRKLIGPNVVFLNTFIENQQGQLYSRIAHHPILPQFTLPYLVGHSKLGHSDWLRWTLIRSVCCCLLIEDFRRERIYLELSYLTNGYSLLFVETHIQNFFEYFHTSHLRYINNQTQYNEFRQKWLDYMSMQYELTDQLQQFDNQDRLIRFNYLYEWGPRCNFNQKFLDLWSEYFCRHPLLSKEKLKILLTTKHEYSLNTLLGGLD
ncbi:unnamed protein product [Adineta steineri]|uniref:Uncharacterized protein n=1 Tax=Adineta steineri TaxID=433720 RepID=A0A814WM84_9BILA|nr:unnamed protein product [Adineta steineri]CAF1477218.1 unnamed protein product [Adineta steineri]